MLMTEKDSFWPLELAMIPSEPMWNPAEARICFALAGL